MSRTHRQDELTDVVVGGVGTTVVEGDHVGVYQITVFIRVDLIRHNTQFIVPLLNATDAHKV